MAKTPVSLLERLRQPSDQDAWARFVALYAPLIHGWGRRVGLQPSDAADLAQEVLLSLLEIMPGFSYDRHGTFRGWLRTLTLNRWRDRHKRRSTQPLPPESPGMAEVAAPDEMAAYWEEEYRQHLTRHALRVMQADFQPATWKACWEVVCEGRPATQVAAELGLTVGAVHAARFRVLGRLREELKGMLD
jgi:RNA polymerase sigma-70 factor (ECF subfamily)